MSSSREYIEACIAHSLAIADDGDPSEMPARVPRDAASFEEPSHYRTYLDPELFPAWTARLRARIAPSRFAGFAGRAAVRCGP